MLAIIKQIIFKLTKQKVVVFAGLTGFGIQNLVHSILKLKNSSLVYIPQEWGWRLYHVINTS